MRRGILVLCLVALGGCNAPQRDTVAERSTEADTVVRTLANRHAQGDRQTDAGIPGRSVEGRPLVHHVVGHGREVVLLVASIHGNEAAGTPLIERLRAEITARPELARGRTVVLVPNANPDGVAQRRRRNANGVDLNRDFPAANRGRGPRDDQRHAIEPETRKIIELVERYDPDTIVSIHQPIGCIDYDGPAGALARSMAQVCDLPVRRLGARPGSLGSWAGVDRGIAVITLELPGSASHASRERLWGDYGSMLLRAVRGSDADGVAAP